MIFFIRKKTRIWCTLKYILVYDNSSSVRKPKPVTLSDLYIFTQMPARHILLLSHRQIYIYLHKCQTYPVAVTPSRMPDISRCCHTVRFIYIYTNARHIPLLSHCQIYIYLHKCQTYPVAVTPSDLIYLHKCQTYISRCFFFCSVSFYG